MQKRLTDRVRSKAFSRFSIDFLYHPERFGELIQKPADLDAFKNQIDLKSLNYTKDRELLQECLNSQYAAVNAGEAVQKNLAALGMENSFTVTTGHQLNLFTGPVFFIYKILHTISLSRKLKEKYPGYNFVPLYWMASEDHDFDEINHAHIFGRKLSWKTGQRGPVGEFKLENWDEILGEARSFFASRTDAPLLSLLEKYTGADLSEATFRLVHELFKDYGLVILDPNRKELKQAFVPHMLREVQERFAEQAVLEANAKLEKMGYKPQVFPRPVNLFYIGKNFRERILFENGVFSSRQLGTRSLEEIQDEIRLHPERFSPNVVLRPLYQEILLPNLAYIGGGAEIAYWTQLKGVFDAAGVLFPLIQIRNSLQLIDKATQKKLAKLKLDAQDFFEDLDTLKKQFVATNSSEGPDFTVVEEKAMELQSVLSHFVTSFDPAMTAFAEAENTKILKQVEFIKSRVLKQQKTRFENELRMLEETRNKFFPNGGLQERTENFISFCPDGEYAAFIRGIYDHIDPFEKDLIILEL